MMKFIVAVLSLLLICCLTPSSYATDAEQHNYKPAAGYVPDEQTAIKIAIAVWTPIYGKEKIEAENPYKAKLKDGIWYVTGSLPKAEVGKFIVGGIAEAEIARDDGRIIRISHGQ